MSLNMHIGDRNISDEQICADVWLALDEVKDPEIPAVSIRELGMVHTVEVQSGRVRVELLPTFVGCPALDIIRHQARTHLENIRGVLDMEIVFVITTPWTSDRLTEEGIQKLRSFGIAPPVKASASRPIPPCPYCGQKDTNLDNLFGPTACRAVYYCRSCQQPFEGMKRV